MLRFISKDIAKDSRPLCDGILGYRTKGEIVCWVYKETWKGSGRVEKQGFRHLMISLIMTNCVPRIRAAFIRSAYLLRKGIPADENGRGCGEFGVNQLISGWRDRYIPETIAERQTT